MAVTVLTSAVFTAQSMWASAAKNKLAAAVPGLDPAAAAQLLQKASAAKLDSVLTVIMMTLAIIISVECIRKWINILRTPVLTIHENEPQADLMKLAEGTEIQD